MGSTSYFGDSSSYSIPTAGSAVSDAESGKRLPSSRYKGVVPQPNGRWGAQIYDKHRRIWLGTFSQEEHAAKAYDVAARRFRGHDAATNLPVEQSTGETLFLKSHSKAEVVDMLRKHTYADELEESNKRYQHKCACMNSSVMINDPRFISPERKEVLFEKALTPSDVGKLNRMVIPKQHAEKHFPLPEESTSTGTLLIFEDNVGKAWRFRYCYWSSSQSYVLTKGWSYFVKEKKLRTGDVVRFGRSTGPEKKLFIDRKPENESEIMEDDHGLIEPMREVRLFGVNINMDQTQMPNHGMGFGGMGFGMGNFCEPF